MTSFRLGFCLGVIAGEGSFSHAIGGNGKVYPRLTVQVHARDRAMLEHLVTEFGGRILGPYMNLSGPFIAWTLTSTDLCRAVPVIEQHMPPSYKREQLIVWLETHRAYFSSPKRALLQAPSTP